MQLLNFSSFSFYRPDIFLRSGCWVKFYRLSIGVGHRCDVVAPSLIPRKAGDKAKTEPRLNAMMLLLLRASQLTEVWVPDEEGLSRLLRLRYMWCSE